MITDVIDHLAGITPGSPLDQLRDRRPGAREHAQRSFDALFSPDSEGEVTLVERDAVAAFVTGLHRDGRVAAFYAYRLAALAPGLLTAVETEIKEGRTTGPYGIYPADGPLAAESDEGLRYRVSDPDALGARLTAAFEHAHLLVFRPREASRQALDALSLAGWTTTGIVTLSQLVAFLSFQVRVVTGLRLLNQKGSAA
ncbi:CMD domain protein [Nonomuraea jiangxiensis]|uniref:CMD domain protein, Avi_7170 family n=1 Tax=Nonomuraea jiangxiensis TaxID=633440 RepID=A0A1G9I2M0_9ACTN|nr:CMD domain protein [Nonomuraea jiangxiensis]SDL19332.1 CMD domain protein, Avi_7170 family [Nonomuraea jiangxiensis]